MSLLDDESKRNNSNHKNFFVIGGVGIVVLLFIIIALLAYVINMNGNKTSLTINGKQYSSSKYLLNKNNVLYIGIEDLTNLIDDGYTFKSGNKDVEDENQCYITSLNLKESTFFTVGSSKIYKVLEDTDDTEYYTLENEIIKENGKIYIPISALKIAFNVKISVNNSKYVISSYGYLENYYNNQKSATFIPDESIVWDTTSANKKLLKYSIVIVKDAVGKLGVAQVSASTDNKTKVTTVSTRPIITPKYDEINYSEQYEQLIVKTKNGRGIVQLEEENGNILAKTLVAPQYNSIKQINNDLFVVSVGSTKDGTDKKFGIINKNGEEILPVLYESIGVDITKFRNNDLNSQYIILDSLIPVKKEGLYGFVNLKGKVVINTQYTDLGCAESNSNSNILIIPELDAIVVKKDKNYGIISKTGKVLVNNVATKVYKEVNKDGNVYYMMYNNERTDVIKYIEKTQSKTQQNKNQQTNKNKNNSQDNDNKENKTPTSN